MPLEPDITDAINPLGRGSEGTTRRDYNWYLHKIPAPFSPGTPGEKGWG